MARKTSREARIERITWFGLTLVFIIMSLDENFSIPPEFAPFACALILLLSSVYQYTRGGWSVSPFTWIATTLLFVLGIWEVAMTPFIDIVLLSMVVVIGLIAIGVLTNDN